MKAISTAQGAWCATEFGTLRRDVSPADVLVGLNGISLATDPERRDQAGRLLDLLMDGLRPRP